MRVSMYTTRPLLTKAALTPKSGRASRMLRPSLSWDAVGRMTPPSHPTTRTARAANANRLVVDISASFGSPRAHRTGGSAELHSAPRPISRCQDDLHYSTRAFRIPNHKCNDISNLAVVGRGAVQRLKIGV